MKISIQDFKGTVPKVSSRALPDKHAQIASNARLQSFDLEAQLGETFVQSLMKTNINTIYSIDRDGSQGGPYWLQWDGIEAPTGVEVARGFTRDDGDTERIYFTGTDRPRVTNRTLATTGIGAGYPYTSYYLGLPLPAGTPTVSTAPDYNNLVVDKTYTINEFNDFYKGTNNAGYTNPNVVDTNVGLGAIRFKTEAPTNGSNAFIVASGNVGEHFYDQVTVTCSADQANALGFTTFFIGMGGSNTGGMNGFTLVQRQSDGAIFAYRSRTADASLTTTGFYGTVFGAPITTAIPFGSPFKVRISLKFKEVLTNAENTPIRYANLCEILNAAGTTVLGSTVGGDIVEPLFGSNVMVASVGHYPDSNAANPVGGINVLLVSEIKLEYGGELASLATTKYVYTFVNAFGEESAPSPASVSVYAGEGVLVSISDLTQLIRPTPGGPLALADADYGIVGYRVYRLVTGTLQSNYQFVRTTDYTTVGTVPDVIPVAVTSTTDNSPDSLLESVLQSLEWIAPPDDARNIVALANGIMLVSSNNVICPSVTGRPHAYPESYRLATDFPVVAMSSIETMAIALTKESTYLIVGSDPSAMSMSLISSVYGCVSRRSVTRWREFGVVYASRQGLVAITAQGAKLLTEAYISRREWEAKYNPTTINGAIYEDVYYGFYMDQLGETQHFTFDLRDAGVGFIDMDAGATAVFSDSFNEALYIVPDGENLFTVNSGAPKTYTWKSKLYQFPYPTSLGCA